MDNMDNMDDVKYLVIASDGVMKLFPNLDKAVHSPFCHRECSIWRCEFECNCHVVQGMMFID